jgi:septal ring factor EnvC (AmiA/AmiB activator)
MADGTDTSLVTIPTADALAVFTTPERIDPILASIRAKIDAFTGDLDTASGRKEIASMAYTVARSKTYLDGIGKQLVDEQKLIPNKIDASRKRIRDTLDAWRDEVRAPLDEWEAAERGRVDRIKTDLAALQNFIDDQSERPSATIRETIASLELTPIGEADYHEYIGAAVELHAKALAALNVRLAAAEKREADAAELARLRAEAEARAEIERKAQADREAAERQAKAEADAAERAKQAAEAAARAERTKAEAAAKAAQEAADRREREHKEELAAVEQRATEAAEKAKADAERAALIEAAETAKRMADIDHRGRINRAALAAFVEAGIPEDVAKNVITLIAARSIPAIAINY